MFIYNKYYKWYNNIISKSKNENRNKGSSIYYESHHVIPKSCGGSNKKSNLVLLTAKEHYIVHILLTKCVDGTHKIKMIRAAYFMMNRNNVKSSRIYERLKTENREILSNLQQGKKYRKVKCTHCNKIIGVNASVRHHFDFCQSNPNLTDEEKKKLKIKRRCGQDTEIVEWCHDLHGTYSCTRHELIDLFPEQELLYGSLGVVKNKKFKTHKGWRLAEKDEHGQLIDIKAKQLKLRNNTIYTWFHKNHGTYTCSSWELKEYYKKDVDPTLLNRVSSGVCNKHLGWVVIKT